MGTSEQHTFASLRVFNYALFFYAGFISNIGGWMARIGQSWLVLTILTDNSATDLGFVTGLQFLPAPLFAIWAGAVADRFPKRAILLVTQVGQSLTALLLAFLVITDSCQLWHVFVLAAVQGTFTAFDNPARMAFVGEMVPDSLISNAVALNSTSFNSARLIGPAIAGFTIAWWGVGPTMLVNAVTFGAVVFGLLCMRSSELRPSEPRRLKGSIGEGVRYVLGRPDVMLLMFLVFMLGTFGMNFQMTNVLMATEAYGLGAEAYGMFGSVMAIGTIFAGLAAARRIRPRIKMIVSHMFGFTFFAALLALAPWPWAYGLLLIPVGFYGLSVITSCNSAVQLAVDPDIRGRVMAIYMAIFFGGTPIGAPIIGWIGDVFGARATILFGAIMTGLAAVWALWHMRRSPETS